MMKPALPPDVLAQAADWFARLQDPAAGPGERARWSAWRAASPQHAQAWHQVETVWGGFDGLPAALAQQTLDQAASRLRARRQALRRGGAGLLGVFGLSLVGWRLLEPQGALQTALGQTRQWALADGGRLWLNTDSHADLDYGPQQRRIRLHEGELLLQAEADSQALPRPLLLETGLAQVSPLVPSRFAWRDEGRGGGLLSVYQGQVELQPRRGPTRRVEAGRSLRLRPGGGQLEGRALALHEAWSRGLLIAENMRLADFLAELSRYRPGRLDCEAALAELRLVGSFPTQDPERALRALAETLPLHIERPLPGWTRLRARA